jgi:hypothetical protein
LAADSAIDPAAGMFYDCSHFRSRRAKVWRDNNTGPASIGMIFNDMMLDQ